MVISLSEREQINARNRATYLANEARAAEEAAAKKLARRKTLAERQARMMETSCGSVEQTGNPRKGCTCDTCSRRRKAKSESQRARRRQRNSVDDRDEDWSNEEYRKERFARFGLTEAEYFAILKAQDYKCPICGTTEPGGQGRNRPSGWHVDHDHKTGRVRGLLCHSCNVGLGHFKDSIESLAAAIEYLKTED